jgi:5'-methylthioadenosine nucleosidase
MAASGPVRKVLLVFAMEQEAGPLVESLSLSKVEAGLPALPAVVYQGRHADLEVMLVQNGKHPKFAVDCAGTVGGALTAYAAIQAFQPDLVINAGTAGGFAKRSPAASIGDAFICSAAANHDRRIPIPGFDVFGVGKLDLVAAPKLVAELGWKSGVVSTSNSLDHVPADDEQMEKNGANVKDMEAAAIADVCLSAGKPFLALKVITDIVDGDRPTQEEFLENLGKAAGALKAAVPRALSFIAGKTVEDL